MRDKLASKEEFRSHTADYYELTTGRGIRLPTPMMDENPSVGVHSTSVKCCAFIHVGMKRMRIMVLRHNSIVEAVFHVNIH